MERGAWQSHVCLTDRLPFLHAHTHTLTHKQPILTHAVIIRRPHTHTFVHLIDCGHDGCGVFIESGFAVILEVSVWLSLNTRQTSTAHKTFNNIIMHNTKVRGSSVCVCVCVCERVGEG